ncbi:hypothetical protein PR048_023633 [Dryococelus australis]|uniref:Uncharacterized protein n=1 Tax=Dryococelus australis TaxID=614101 RepID=A0ABQ9GUM3_9NEOP|nr:hypothetical protein PR048_023633 [Dryococelus australis]
MRWETYRTLPVVGGFFSECSRFSHRCIPPPDHRGSTDRATSRRCQGLYSFVVARLPRILYQRDAGSVQCEFDSSPGLDADVPQLAYALYTIFTLRPEQLDALPMSSATRLQPTHSVWLYFILPETAAERKSLPHVWWLEFAIHAAVSPLWILDYTLQVTARWCSLWRRLIATKGEPGSVPSRFTTNFRKCELCRTMPLVGGFSRGYPVSPPLNSIAAPYSTHFVLTGSTDFDVESRPNLFTHSPATRGSVYLQLTGNPAVMRFRDLMMGLPPKPDGRTDMYVYGRALSLEMKEGDPLLLCDGRRSVIAITRDRNLVDRQLFTRLVKTRESW